MALLIRYKPSGETLRRFHRSDKQHRLIVGPYGSGKTTTSFMEIYRRCIEQKPDSKGTRRSRWLVLRATNAELQFTTIPTWKTIFGDALGAFSEGSGPKPAMHHWRFARPDGTHVDAEILFIGLDGADGVSKATGAYLTGAFFNELKTIDQAVYEKVKDRCGRYPEMREGGPTWYGSIADTNPPDQDHWLYRLAEEIRPDNMETFKQPGGVIKVGEHWVVNPAAENLPNLPPNYYSDGIKGKSEDAIKVDWGGEYGFVREGRPVYPEYVDSVHTAPADIRPMAGVPIDMGFDFGLTPAATFGQRLPIGRVVIFRELVAENMGADRFGRVLRQVWNQEFAGFKFGKLTGDPSGTGRADSDESTPFDMLAKHGFAAEPAITNDPDIRRDAFAGLMTRMGMDGKPMLLISPRCTVLRKGLAGGYGFRRLKIANEERYADKVVKNAYSHVCEAGQYQVLGIGEGDRVLTGEDPVERERRWAREAEREEAFDPMRW